MFTFVHEIKNIIKKYRYETSIFSTKKKKNKLQF